MNRIIYQDEVGESTRPIGPLVSTLPIPETLKEGLIRFFGLDIQLSPPQAWAIEHGILDANKHFLVCAQTNSGKTLIALLRIFYQAIEKGGRSVLVVPLKALAEEKAEELKSLASHVKAAGGPSIKIRVSTGDYQLSDDFLGSPPPDTGEVMICTPERLEVILRNPDYLEWARSCGTYVIDEFHLLGESGRGANMESLVTRLLLHVTDSSIVGLSATVGDPDRVAGWLGSTEKPIEVLDSQYRFPVLKRVLIETEDKNAFVLEQAEKVSQSLDQSLLVFVYRKNDAEKLCNFLNNELAGDVSTGYFHAGLPLAKRRVVAEKFRRGDVRVLVATTSLKMGINTPATHVIVRDTVFHGSGRLVMSDILQMIGRAGRGNLGGTGYILCGPDEGDAAYVQDLKNGNIGALEPRLIPQSSAGWKKKIESDDSPNSLNAVLLSEIARSSQAGLQDLGHFLATSYSAWCQTRTGFDLSTEVSFLERAKLIYRVENAESTYSATKLGRTVAYSGLSPESGAMLASFIRALINLGEKAKDEQAQGNYLRRLRDLDLLFISLATFEARTQLLRAPSKQGLAIIEEYIEALPVEEKPLVNLWRSEDSKDYPTRRLISSLGFKPDTTKINSAAVFAKLMGTAILLHRHAKGESIHSLADEYKVQPGALESGLKYTVTWVLSCLAQICSPQKCYKLEFLSMQAYGLLEDLSLGASLGKLISIKGVGRRSIAKLVNQGYVTIHDIGQLSESEMCRIGIKGDKARRISRFLKRVHR